MKLRLEYLAEKWRRALNLDEQLLTSIDTLGARVKALQEQNVNLLKRISYVQGRRDALWKEVKLLRKRILNQNIKAQEQVPATESPLTLVTARGQVKEGDVLLLLDRTTQQHIPATARLVQTMEQDGEEIILTKGTNLYIKTESVLQNKSWVLSMFIVKNGKMYSQFNGTAIFASRGSAT